MAFLCHYQNQLAFIRSIKHQFALLNSLDAVAMKYLFFFHLLSISLLLAMQFDKKLQTTCCILVSRKENDQSQMN